MKEKENLCISCGLCCIYYPTNAHKSGISQEWALIEDNETNNIPRTLYRITRNPPKVDFHKEIGANKFIKDKPDNIWKGYRRCVALEGIQTRNIGCSVYENRPKVCRDFEPGSERCNHIREWGGLKKYE